MTLSPPTIDRVALVRLRLQHGKCPACGGAKTGRRICCRACTAAGLRYCPAREHVAPSANFGPQASYCRPCAAALKAETYAANPQAGRDAWHAQHRRRAAREGRTITPNAEVLARQRAARAVWAAEVEVLRAAGWTWARIGAHYGISSSGVQNRMGKHRQWLASQKQTRKRP